MNESAKAYMRKVKSDIVSVLETTFPLIELFEDEVPESETIKYDNGTPYFFMVMKFGPISKQDNEKFLSQEFTVDFYAENKADVDETTIDIISVVKNIKSIRFQNSNKFRARHANTDRFVDIVSIDFIRMMKIEC